MIAVIRGEFWSPSSPPFSAPTCTATAASWERTKRRRCAYSRLIVILLEIANAGALGDRSSEPLEKKRLEMPYQRSVLSLDEAHKAMDRMLQEAFKAPDRPVAIAICDDQGELIEKRER
jgi:hypothetical protein